MPQKKNDARDPHEGSSRVWGQVGIEEEKRTATDNEATINETNNDRQNTEANKETDNRKEKNKEKKRNNKKAREKTEKRIQQKRKATTNEDHEDQRNNHRKHVRKKKKQHLPTFYQPKLPDVFSTITGNVTHRESTKRDKKPEEKLTRRQRQ